MTRNQIEFAKLQESRRAAQVAETQQALRDRLNYEIQSRNLEEVGRHNLATEAFNLQSLDETSRHNLAQEEYNRNYLLELGRANLARESETSRHNLAMEVETSRSNLARETETRRMNDISASFRNLELDLQRQSLSQTALRDRQNFILGSESNMLRRLSIDESVRSNRANENIRLEQNRMTREQNEFYRSFSSRQQDEVERANLAREQFNLSSLSETSRSNRAKENISWANLGETQRSNMARESLTASAQAETARANAANEYLRDQQNQISRSQIGLQREYNSRNLNYQQQRLSQELYLASQQMGLSYDELRERIRHNIESEDVAQSQVTADWFSTVSNSVSRWLPIMGGVFSVN